MKKVIILLLFCCFAKSNLYAKWPYFVECDNGRFGFIEKSGNMIISCEKGYDVARDYSEDFAAVSRGEKNGFIDKTGKEVIPIKYDWVYSFSENLAVVNRADKCGFVDKTGKEVIKCQYEDAWSFSEGLAVVSRNDKSGFIDKTGALVIPCKYDEASPFSEGLAVVVTAKGSGFIDKTTFIRTIYYCQIFRRFGGGSNCQRKRLY
ncbi:hypothetical protein FACS189456_2620 [Bacteroidia bacterium]|nr:hypothetical protein FACS189456_2620 [Bacteroidia bacterium]